MHPSLTLTLWLIPLRGRRTSPLLPELFNLSISPSSHPCFPSMLPITEQCEIRRLRPLSAAPAVNYFDVFQMLR